MMSSKRSSSTPPSAAIVLGNHDLLTEILVWLPTKFLVRLKVVSKQWYSLISAPSFCHLHTANHRFRPPETQPLFFLGSQSSKYRVYNPTAHRFLSFSFSFPIGFSNVRILQSCNGLLLLRCGKAKEGDSHSYHVLNPTTMQQKRMSPPPTSSAVAAIYLLFDPSLSPHYRVACFAKNKKGTLIYVYESETHKWKLGGESNKRASSFSKGIYFNGGIYFLRVGSSSSFRFDPDNNVSKIPSPPRHYSPEMRNENYTMESNGVLLSLTLSAKEGCNLLYVSEMKESENRWTKKYQTDLNLIMALCGGHNCCAMNLLGMIRGEKEQDSLLLFRLNGKIKIYKFYDDVFEDLYDITSKEFQKENWEWYVEDGHHFFIQSLAPL